MTRVHFTRNLLRFFPDLREADVDAGTVAEALELLEGLHPGLSSYLVDEHGALRRHVNAFIGKSMVTDRRGLSDELGEADELYFFQALSGGRDEETT